METKRCSKCDNTKSLSEFGLRSGKPQPYCKSCNKAYQKEHYLQNKEKYLVEAKVRRKEYKIRLHQILTEYAKDGCEECGEKDFVCLEFDHIDRETKEFDVGMGISNQTSLARIITELKKCRVLCANCHRRRTAIQMGWYKFLEE